MCEKKLIHSISPDLDKSMWRDLEINESGGAYAQLARMATWGFPQTVSKSLIQFGGDHGSGAGSHLTQIS